MVRFSNPYYTFRLDTTTEAMSVYIVLYSIGQSYTNASSEYTVSYIAFALLFSPLFCPFSSASNCSGLYTSGE